MKDKMCVSVYGKIDLELYENIEKAQSFTQLIEVRLDYLEVVDVSVLETLSQRFADLKLIITYRMKEFGGEFGGGFSDWLGVMKRVIEFGFEYIDIDLALAKRNDLMADLVRLRQDSNSKTQFIISYHNFQMTPDFVDLEIIGNEMSLLGADIQKFATTVITVKDLKKLAIHLSYKVPNDRYVVVGMGDNKFAKQSRIMSLFLGSEFSFFSLGEKSTAQGQISAQEGLQILGYLM